MTTKWYYLGLLLLLLGCGADSVDKEAVLLEMAGERIAKFRSNALRDCRAEVMEAANQRADSLLLERARRMRLLADRPPKPQRPGQPATRELSEALPLRPLFPYEVRFDTVLRQQLTTDSLLLDTLQYVDTLTCEECYVWTNPEISIAPGEERSTDDLYTGPSVLEIYQLLCGLNASCFTNEDYAKDYRRQLYDALLEQPRAFELCLQTLDPEGQKTGFYTDPLSALPGEDLDLDLVLESINAGIIDKKLQQQLAAVIERAKAF